MGKKNQKNPTKPKHREALQGKGFKTAIVNPDPRLQPDYVPGPVPVCLARGLVLCQVQKQEESCLWSHFSCTEPAESRHSVLLVIYTSLGHQDVSWSISNHQGLLHQVVPAAALKQNNLPFGWVQFLGKFTSLHHKGDEILVFVMSVVQGEISTPLKIYIYITREGDL